MAPIMEHPQPTTSQVSSITEEIVQKINAHSESLLLHRNLTESLQSNVTSENITQILSSADQLLAQYVTLKTQLTTFLTRQVDEKPKASAKAPRMSRNNNHDRSKEANLTKSAEPETRASKKRSWDNDFREDKDDSLEHTVNERLRKRLRTTRISSQDHEAVEDFVPVALQKDDISDEVARRLKLKERRKARSAEPERKRKRDSSSSHRSAKTRVKRD